MDAKLTLLADTRPRAIADAQSGSKAESPVANRSGEMFARAWAEARAAMPTRAATEVVVEPGDTLSGIVRQTVQRREGLVLDSAQTMALVRRVAEANGIANADRIYPGQRIAIADFLTAADRAALATSQSAGLASRNIPQQQPSAPPAAAAASASGTAQNLRLREAAQGNPLLERTLGRAVEKRFISPAERPAVERRILALSRQFGFSPDDFARVALMESDGLNPRASNGRCHGIIQFCEGQQRGAASVGMAGRAQSILSMGVLRQLDLVERYFRDTGLDRLGGKVSLDDLYLTVLTPAARATRDPGEALSIPGQQAAVLYPDGNRNAAITRTSLLEGLRRNADHRLNNAAAQQLGSLGGRRQNLAAAVGQSSPVSAQPPGNSRLPAVSLTPEEPAA